MQQSGDLVRILLILHPIILALQNTSFHSHSPPPPYIVYSPHLATIYEAPGATYDIYHVWLLCISILALSRNG